jgi:hypothetical protein
MSKTLSLLIPISSAALLVLFRRPLATSNQLFCVFISDAGACASFLGIDADTLLANHAAGRVCWDDNDVMGGRPTAACRASFGWSSSYSDVAALKRLIADHFIAQPQLLTVRRITHI